MHSCQANCTGLHLICPELKCERLEDNTTGGSTQNWRFFYMRLLRPADRVHRMHHGVGWFLY